MIAEEAAEALRQNMIVSAFTAWQTGNGKQGESFEKYLERFGLDEKGPELSKEDRKRIAKKAIADAERIRESFKAGKFTCAKSLH